MSLNSENWDFLVDIEALEKQLFYDFRDKIQLIGNQVYNLLNGGILIHHVSNNGNLDENIDEDLKSLIEKNKMLKLDIDSKIEEISQNKAMYENYKQDRELLSQEVKKTHEAFLTAKKYYKKFLNIYYTIEHTNDSEQIIFLQFFTESKRENEIYSVRFSRSDTGEYKLIDMKPKIESYDELQRRLQETNDIPAILSSIRQIFLKLKHSK